MKKTFVIVAILTFVAGTAAFALGGGAGTVSTTKHNMSVTGTGTVVAAAGGETQICIFCHTPHNATTTAPLWNHTATAAVYQTYTSSTLETLNAVTPANMLLTQSAQACLCCHDGTIAVGSVVRYYGQASPYVIPLGGVQAGGQLLALSAGNLGTDLRNDHPIGFSYTAADNVSDPGLRDPAFVITATGPASGQTITAALTFGATNNLECASCHIVHGSATFNTAEYAPLLRLSKAASAMCLTCHVK